MVIPRFADAALSGGTLEVNGDGLQSRCFLHVHDAVDGIMALAQTSDLLMPALIGFVACVLSIIWAREAVPPASAGATSAMALNQGFMVNPSFVGRAENGAAGVG